MTNNQTEGVVTELRLRGYAVLPAPRQVELMDGHVRVDGQWTLLLDGVDAGDIAVRTLQSALRQEHRMAGEIGKASPSIRLALKKGAIATGLADGRDDQAYRLRITESGIDITGNAPAGLFYGVQTLIQLLEGDGRERCVLPLGTITDWPRYELRFVHWDTKHHQDRLETLKRYMDWSARFKINMISMEIEDKFEYPSHPDIAAPGAFTTAQLQELTRYGLERHIQLVPNLQAPNHMAYVLKHPKYAYLKCDGSNYQIIMEELEALKLIFDMYDDLVRANPGVKYFHVSTDEMYYAGIDERRYKPYNPVNRSQTFVDFVRKAHEHLARHGRRIIIWAEHPLLPQHVAQLPADIIDGIVGHPGYVEEEMKMGMRQLAYSPMQGAEMLFPTYFSSNDESGGGGKPGRLGNGRLVNGFNATSRGRAKQGNPIGTFCATWDDSGLHNECFWLGWATMAQYGWIPGRPSVEQTAADFYDIYYGRQVHGIGEIYQLMHAAARTFEGIWEDIPSRVRGPAYGNSQEKGPKLRRDLTLSAPALPRSASLEIDPVYKTRYARQLADAPRKLAENDRLLALLHENLPRAARNRYNLEVFISMAQLVRHTLQMVIAMGQIEDLLGQAREADGAEKFPRALDLLGRAHGEAGRVIERRKATLAQLTAVWEKSRLPRGASVGGREFLHVMDDVKDHKADRRPDMSYMTMMEEQMNLEGWRESLAGIIREYGRVRGLPVTLGEDAEAPMMG